MLSCNLAFNPCWSKNDKNASHRTNDIFMYFPKKFKQNLKRQKNWGKWINVKKEKSLFVKH